MIHAHVEQIAATLRLMTGGLCALLGLRFAGVSLADLGREQQEQLTGSINTPSTDGAAAGQAGRGQQPGPPSQQQRGPGGFPSLGPGQGGQGPMPGLTGTPPEPAKNKPVKATLSVLAGPPRSPVYINGNLEGKTPFLADISCRFGETVRIEIVPDEGPMIIQERPCHGGTMRVVDEPEAE